MNLFEYITANMMTDEEKSDITNATKMFINKVFSQDFASELNHILDKIKIEDKSRKDDVIAMTYKDKIQLNTHEFYALSKTEQVAFITHELIHAANNKGNYRLKLLAKNLWKFYNKNVIKGADVSLAMVGKARVSSRWINKNETVNYLLTEPIRWQYLKPDSKKEFIDILEKSKLFNLNDSFWKKQLSLI